MSAGPEVSSTMELTFLLKSRKKLCMDETDNEKCESGRIFGNTYGFDIARDFARDYLGSSLQCPRLAKNDLEYIARSNHWAPLKLWYKRIKNENPLLLGSVKCPPPPRPRKDYFFDNTSLRVICDLQSFFLFLSPSYSLLAGREPSRCVILAHSLTL